MKEDVHEYAGEAIDVTWDGIRCIHARECVKGLPNVFDVEQRPWIRPDQASADEVAEVVLRCPTGALHFERHDGGPAESVPETNQVSVSPGGPLYVRGDVTVETPDGEELLSETRVALCRCGASGNKPLCDGAHSDAGFDAEGTVTAGETPDGWTPTGPVTVVPTPDGPLQLRGNVEIRGQTDGSERSVDGAWLCRCGASANRPFCDGSHGDVGFSSEE
jgi:CDGSH-type Zn-finger protein/uncharacterized Fe-S cluster protein YjdI